MQRLQGFIHIETDNVSIKIPLLRRADEVYGTFKSVGLRVCKELGEPNEGIEFVDMGGIRIDIDYVKGPNGMFFPLSKEFPDEGTTHFVTTKGTHGVMTWLKQNSR